MFALLAALCFLLALLGVGAINWVVLGFLFVAVHLAFPLVFWSVPSRRYPRG